MNNLRQILKDDLNEYCTVIMITKENSHCHHLKLNIIHDLEEITKITQNRDKWRHLSINITRAGEAAESVDAIVEPL